MPTAGQQYLLAAIRLLKENSLYASRIDWPVLEASFLLKAQAAEHPKDVYGLISQIIRDNELRHHAFLSPKEWRAYKGETPESEGVEDKIEMPQGKALPSGIGYLRVPACGTTDALVLQQYSNELQRIIRALKQTKKVKGWVVDLRDNTGGNSSPMVAGLEPLLGEGPLGRARVAVLVNGETASSGELVAIGFIGRKNAVLIGQKTRGLCTSNEAYELSDGAALWISTTVFADRSGNQYENGITPDIITSEERTLPRAIDWLINMPN